MLNHNSIIHNNLRGRKFWLILTVSLLFSACGGGGGGGGGGDDDTTPPIVTVPANINVAASSVAGTPATDTAIAAFLADTSAMDNVDGAVSVSNNAPGTFPAATTTTVTFSASDTAGNIGTATATVTVDVFDDSTPPVVTAPANINVAASSVAGTPATDTAIAAFLADTSAMDNIDGVVSVSNNAPGTFPAATTTTVTFSASDTAGNIGTATSTVTVAAFVEDTTWTGTKQLGVAGADTKGFSVATDADGNIYVAGRTDGALDGNTLTGTSDFFVTKYNNLGTRQYTRQLGVAGASTGARAVATDVNGNVYVAGSTDGGLDGNKLTGTYDFFVTKYDSMGSKQYTRQLGVAGEYTFGSSIATDVNGNVYVAGNTYGGLDGNVLTGSIDFFVTKYDSMGTKQYTRQLGASGVGIGGISVATDANGNVYVAGETPAALDGNTLTGYVDFFVTKYDSMGIKQYTRQLGVSGSFTNGFSVTTDANSNVYVAGHTNGGLDGNTLTGSEDFFVTKYDSMGSKQYTRQLGVAAARTFGASVNTDPSGNVYVAGYTEGGLDGNTPASTVRGLFDFFVTKYDNVGNKQHTRQLGVAGADTYGFSVATDANGDAYVAGYINGGLDGNTLTGIFDFFVTKYDSTGVKQ